MKRRDLETALALSSETDFLGKVAAPSHSCVTIIRGGIGALEQAWQEEGAARIQRLPLHTR